MSFSRNVLIATAVAALLAGGSLWYLWSATSNAPWADPDDARLVRLGKELYAAHCASCHGRNLEGEPDWRRRRPDGTFPAPPHDATGHSWHHADRVLFDITEKGGQHNAPPGFKSGMPAFGGVLSDREIYAVLAYIKSRWPDVVRERQARINAQTR